MEATSPPLSPQVPDPEPSTPAASDDPEDFNNISLEDPPVQSREDLSTSMSILREDLKRRGIPETNTKPIDYVIVYHNYEGPIDTGGCCCCCGRDSNDAELEAHQVNYDSDSLTT